MIKGRSTPMLCLGETTADNWFSLGLQSVRLKKETPEAPKWVISKRENFGLTAGNWTGSMLKNKNRIITQKGSSPRIGKLLNDSGKDGQKVQNSYISNIGHQGVNIHRTKPPSSITRNDPNQALIISQSFEKSSNLQDASLDHSFKRRKLGKQVTKAKFKLLASNCFDSLSLKQGLKTLQSLTSRKQEVDRKMASSEQAKIDFNFSLIQELLLLADVLQADRYWSTEFLELSAKEASEEPFKCEIEAIKFPHSKFRISFQPKTLLGNKLASSNYQLSASKPFLSKQSLGHLPRRYLLSTSTRK